MANPLDSQSDNPTIAIAATFTADPLEKSLSFWLQELEQTAHIQFAAYDQVFQELLNPSSLLANNQNGVNVILIRLEDWDKQKYRLKLKVSQAEKEDLLLERNRHILPSQIEVAHLNRYETEYLYQEIFIDQVYARHGIVLKEDACVIDVGANIGLFTLFIQQKCPEAKIYAFEPAPKTFQALEANAKLYCQDAQLFNCGLSGEEKEETFVFYPRSSVFSGFAADVNQDRKAIRSVILNILQKDRSLMPEQIENLADEFLAGRLEKETYQVQLKTLSNIIEEQQIQQIDLLKLDAEKSELAILEGIREEHWPLIQQIITEVHDRQGETLKAVVDLLNTKGFIVILNEETLLQGSGLYSIYASRPHLQVQVPQSQSNPASTPIEQTLQELIGALQTSTSRGIPHILCICPSSAPDISENHQPEKYQHLVEWLEQELKDIKGLNLIKPSEILQLYPIKDYYDPYGDELGHIPYTLDFYHILGTLITRKTHSLTKSAAKVIVLDCDQTLWKGICGEDGVSGIEIDEPRRVLHEFMLAQQREGKLLCLCSKNIEADVWDVFDYHSSIMHLQKKDIISWRINWLPKSENLRALAQELQLGLDSFIFIDDNPLECAEVRVNCPEVLTLQLPESAEQIPNFLKHIWAFDGRQTTQEDLTRTELYRQNVEREKLRQQSMTFQNFIEGLDLKINIESLSSATLPRVAQLTQRTNQFNATTIRRNEAELQKIWESGQLEGAVVQVKDRFGDYGWVGVLLFVTEAESLKVDTLLLSCRALGRGVEHQMLRYLGTTARERGLDWVEIAYLKTAKNQPMLNFLKQVGLVYQQATEKGLLFRFPTQVASQITLQSEPNLSLAMQEPTLPKAETLKVDERVVRSSIYQRIATELSQSEDIIKAIQSRQQIKPRSLKQPLVPPLTFIEKQLVGIWQNLLQIEAVGIKDDYFEIGGTSLQSVELFAQIERNLAKKLPLTTLLEAPTIARLAERISCSSELDRRNQLIQLTEGITQPPLFLVHDGDGEVLLYRNLAQSLQVKRWVYGIQPYSQDGFPMLHTRIEEMATYYIEQMREIQPTGPYLIGGMCAGGVIAFEIARQLQQQGQEIALLAIIDAADVKATKRAGRVTGGRWQRLSSAIAQDSQFSNRLDILRQKVMNLITYETQTKLTALSEHLKMRLFRFYLERQKSLPPFLQDLSVRTVYTFAEKDYHPLDRYQGEIVLFRAIEGVGSDEPYVQIYDDPLLGWGQRATRGVKVFDIPGGHSSMLQEPNAQVLARQMESYIDSVLSEEPNSTHSLSILER